jgi:thiopeptide-type bacteriocin biosynthesis protein
MRTSQWLQVNVALSRSRGSALASARAVLGEIATRLPAWRRARSVTCFFFMRKPPDLRLRFAGPSLAMQVQPALTQILRVLRKAGAVDRFHSTRYEPEHHLFGGAAAMRLIHRHFDCDSGAWIALDRLSQAGSRTALPADGVPTAVLNDLFLRMLGDRFEVWDVWRNLTILTNGADRETSESRSAGIPFLGSLIPLVQPEERRILKRYEQANRRLSDGLRGLNESGRLTAGLRGILPFIAMFHLHRHGYGKDRQAALAQAMASAWNPRHSLHGAAPSMPADRLRPMIVDEAR